MTGANISEGDNAVVKSEPDDASAPTAPGQAAQGQGEAVNTLQAKKKKRRRSPSSDDMPAPMAPLRTIRLERTFDQEDQTLEWNILEDARARGMVEDWLPVDDDKEIVADVEAEVSFVAPDESVPPPSGAPSGGIFGMMDADEDAEAIARRLEEKYKDTAPKKRSAKVCPVPPHTRPFTPLTQPHTILTAEKEARRGIRPDRHIH